MLEFIRGLTRFFLMAEWWGCGFENSNFLKDMNGIF
jgi:hypothetical protein